MSVDRQRARLVRDLRAAALAPSSRSDSAIATLLRAAAQRIEHDGTELAFLIYGEEPDGD